MTYILREITTEDKTYFNKKGLISPFGCRISYGRYMVENITENIKMALIGGQGIMYKDGVEWSEMAAYSAIIWKEEIFIIEYYRHNECIRKMQENEYFEMT